MRQAIRRTGAALRRGARRGWAAVRALGAVEVLAGLLALGQWGLVAGLSGSVALAVAGLAGPWAPVTAGAIVWAVLAAGLVLSALGPVTLGAARGVLGRLRARPEALRIRRRAIERRAWALALLAGLASAGLVLAGGPAAREALVLLSMVAVMVLAPLCLATGWMGWRLGLSGRARRGLLLAGSALTLLVMWGSETQRLSLPPPDDWVGLLAMGLLLLAGYLGCAAWTLLLARRIRPVFIPSPVLAPAAGPPLAPVAPPPPPIELPRSPVTGMVRRRLEL